MENVIKYPVGIQSFRSLRENGFVYIDKTEYIYNLVSRGKYYFLSRPRRFGKSLLLSTIHAYFEGRKELFDGLAICKYEQNWNRHPVLRIDLSGESYEHPDKLLGKLDYILSDWEKTYGANQSANSPGSRFSSVIRNACEKTGSKVVVLIDEYDKPLLENLHDNDFHELIRTQLRGFYSVIKECDEYIQFAMLTGVTKFGHVSIFSGLNNLNDISLLPQYNAICGINESEFHEYFHASVRDFAGANDESEEEVWAQFKNHYDGYRFSYPAEGVYNPFSALMAFSNNCFGNYWFSTGSPDYLIKVFKKDNFVFSDLEGQRATAEDLRDMANPENNLIPLLYQSGYLTIKGYDPVFKEYTLGFPNQEVRTGFWSSLYKNYVFGGYQRSVYDISNFVKDVLSGNAEGFMSRLQSLISSVSPGTLRDKEIYFQNLLQVIFSMTGFYTQTEIHMASGRADMMVTTAKYIYIFEFKIDGSSDAALSQIKEKGYMTPYLSERKEIILIGANMSSASNNLSDYIIEKSQH